MKNVGQEISRIIKEKRLVQKDVADTIGISPVYLSNIMHKPSIDAALLERISMAIKISPSFFFDDYGTTKQHITGDCSAASIHGDATAINYNVAKANEIKLLRELLADKERLIQILMKK